MDFLRVINVAALLIVFLARHQCVLVIDISVGYVRLMCNHLLCFGLLSYGIVNRMLADTYACSFGSEDSDAVKIPSTSLFLVDLINFSCSISAQCQVVILLLSLVIRIWFSFRSYYCRSWHWSGLFPSVNRWRHKKLDPCHWTAIEDKEYPRNFQS